MIKLPSSIPIFISALIVVIILMPHLTFARPFDWQYSRIGAPFAVFYNSSLIGDNPGYTFGVDAKLDSVNYDVRGAVTIPLSRVMKREILLRENVNNRFRYANQSYRSSRSAVSIGGIYNDGGDYQINAGFAVPIYLVQSGLSFNLAYRDDNQVGGINLAFSADMPKYMKGRLFYAGLNNLIVSDRDGSNDMNLFIGTAGVWDNSGPHFFFIPYELTFVSHIKNGVVSLIEGTARINLDFTTIHTSRETFGQLPAASAGYTITRKRGGDVTHSFFANFGITFINRSSSAGLMGSYGRRDRTAERHAAFFYSGFGRGEMVGTDGDITARLAYNDAGNDKLLFALKSTGTTIHSWVLRIDNPRGDNIRTYSGGNVVPSTIFWDALKGDGSVVEDEIVYVRLVLKGDSRVVESNVIGIEFVNGRPVVSE